MFLSRLLIAPLALCLGLPSQAHARLAGPCPSAGSANADDRIVDACLLDADAARARGDLHAAGVAHRAAVDHARRAFDNGRKDPAFVKTEGSNLVFFSTEHCSRAKELEPAARDELFAACIDLLQFHIEELNKISIAVAEQTAASNKTLTTLLKLRDSFILPPAKDDRTVNPGSPAVTPPIPTNSKHSPTVLPAQPSVRATVVPPRPTKPIANPIPRQVPRGLYAGLGISVSASVASVVLLGVSAAAVQNAKKIISAEMSECGVETTDACSVFETTRQYTIASSVLLGVSLVASAIFTGLIVHHRRQHMNKVVLTTDPMRSGMTGGFVLRF